MKVVIFDDDPTGSQTVCDCPLLLRWDQQALINALNHSSSLLFLLVNTRSMSAEAAENRIRQTCQSINHALKDVCFSLEDVFFVSRGDSTLRGHGVLEPKIINEILGPFDATFHIPAFFEGGRTTVNGVHLLHGCPVHKTEFARDQTFGYSTSALDLWLEEKSKGAIVAENVVRLTTQLLDEAGQSAVGMKKLVDCLIALSGNQSVVVDAELPSQLAALGQAVRSLQRQKRFLFRSAASFINGLANSPVQFHHPEKFSAFRLKTKSGQLKPGLVMVGSYVALADQQLKMLLRQDSCTGLELQVQEIANAFETRSTQRILFDLENQLLEKLRHIIALNKTPVFYSSRGGLHYESSKDTTNLGNKIAYFMANIVAKITPTLGYIISKGGITTNVFLEKGLNLDSVQLKGQLLPGLSLVCADGYLLARGLPIVTFPGNLGDQQTLLSAWRIMEGLN